MEGVYTLHNRLPPNSLFCLLDIKYEHLHVSIHPVHQQLLRFVVRIHDCMLHIKYVALPFLEWPPHQGYSKNHGKSSRSSTSPACGGCPYLDNSLILGRTFSQVVENLRATI